MFWKNSRRAELLMDGSLPDSILARTILDCAGAMVMALDLEGRIVSMNPASERLLGYHASDLVGSEFSVELLIPQESQRVTMEFQRLAGAQPSYTPACSERVHAIAAALSSLSPSQTPSFETSFQRKDGTTLPALLHIAALRGSDGSVQGLVVVALDHTATMRQHQDVHESQERYRDLFENSSEMIATLTPGGQFLYANHAWQQIMGTGLEALHALHSFEDVFSADCRAEAALLFHRALNGEIVDSVPLRSATEDGRVLELELSLSRRQKAGKPLAVRCLLRDVTQQKQREHRLALQLAVSQIVAESATVETAASRILEAICVSQRWNLGFLWRADAETGSLSYAEAWGSPGRDEEEMIQSSLDLSLDLSLDASIDAGSALAGRAWKEGRAVWISDLATAPHDQRIQAAMHHGMGSGLAIPVRAGNNTLAVLEFFSRWRLCEDQDLVSAVETVAAPLGQMLARTRERGRTEELYRQQEILLNTVADGICGLDKNGIVTFLNPAAAKLLGAAAASLTGGHIHDLLHPDDRCGEDCTLRQILGSQAIHSGEGTVYRADGSSFPCEYILTPILDRRRFAGSVLSFRDISHRYALDRMKSEFIATVSHELRTPLASIRGALGLLSSGMLAGIDEKAANMLRIATANSERLARLINDILDLERIQSSRAQADFTTVQLGEVVRQSIDGLRPVAETAGVQLLQDNTQVEITGNTDRLLQVFTNLLSNAIKFSPAHSSVSILLKPEPDGVTISIIDQGRGIPANMLETIFDRFRQVDSSDAREKGGSGLGLAICRTIVDQHGGRIWAERNPVRGSTFRVFLPYRQEQSSATGNTAAMQAGR